MGRGRGIFGGMDVLVESKFCFPFPPFLRFLL